MKKPLIDRLLELMEQRLKSEFVPVERALLALLVKHKDRLPKLDGYFHKAFRQCDVIQDGDGTTDMVIWNLLHASKLFWECKTEVERRKPRNKPAIDRVAKYVRES